MIVDSNIYDEVIDDVYFLEPEYEAIKAKVAKIVEDGGTVPEDLKKEKFKKVFYHKFLLYVTSMYHFYVSREWDLTT